MARGEGRGSGAAAEGQALTLPGATRAPEFLGLRVQELGFNGLGLRSLGFRGLRFRVWGLRFRVFRLSRDSSNVRFQCLVEDDGGQITRLIFLDAQV